jgi:hypothetical protein
LKLKCRFLSLVLLTCLASFCAMASTVNFTIPGGSLDNASETVNASASVTTVDGGIVTVILNNLTAANLMHSAGQTLSDFTFTLTGITTAVTNTNEDTPTGVLFNINSGPVAGTVGKWGFSNSTSAYTLTDLVNGNSPAQTILGGTVGEAFGDYTIANPSLTGNHNPFLQGTETFTLHITGVDHNTAIASSAIFSFGTAACGTGPEDGKCVTGGQSPVPEPSSTAFLVIAGAVMAFAFRRKVAARA